LSIEIDCQPANPHLRASTSPLGGN
jgi:hypothetical protein